jgi:peroxiredoxin
MRAHLLKFVFIVLFIPLFSAAQTDIKKVDDFKLKDYNGKQHSLSDYAESKAVVLMFIATECPVSNDYNSRMAELHKKYSGKDVAFIGINSNKAENVQAIKEHAAKNNLKFVILKDEGNKIADKLGAGVTPEVYLLNSSFDVLYHGRIDDSRDASSISREDLAAAIDEVLSGKKVSTVKTKAFGCTIKRI